VHRVARPLGSHLAGAPFVRHAAASEPACAGAGAVCLANGGNADWRATWVHYVHAMHEPSVHSLRARASTLFGRGYYLRREAQVLRRAEVVICNSRRTANDVARIYGVAASRVHVIYYGCDARTFGPITDQDRTGHRAALGVADRHIAVFVGALGDRRKGFDILFDAWSALVRDPTWDVDLVVAGAGAERDAWAARAEREGLSPRIRFLGFRSDIANVIAAADVLVHPARYEAYGLSVHEAICRGVPAIVTRGAGVAERWPPTLGALLLPNPADAISLVAALRGWRDRVQEWRAAIAPVSAELRARSWDDMAADVVALLETA
jgi:glycosyltransferase involved in cell wall biosynthesis